jgi:succinate-semialdehyde dehydrogenase/glutarate-semialdehyde dehydrogenase
LTNQGGEIVSFDPARERVIARFQAHSESHVQQALDTSYEAFLSWRQTSFAERGAAMHRLADVLRDRVDRYAELITVEMGKPITQAIAEIRKSAGQCDFFADNAAGYLEDEPLKTGSTTSYLSFEPVGVVLAVMPWNFPFSQVTRFAAPAVMAGNTVILKHASNVPQCAMAIEEAFAEAGFPAGIFTSLLISSGRVADLIADSRIRAVTVTGSSEAGADIASAAGAALKKTVLELGGSDPFIVWADADLPKAAAAAAKTRLSNSGQACAAG